MNQSRAMQREVGRNQKYFSDDIQQPYNPDGKRNIKYWKIYGDQNISKK